MSPKRVTEMCHQDVSPECVNTLCRQKLTHFEKSVSSVDPASDVAIFINDLGRFSK